MKILVRFVGDEAGYIVDREDRPVGDWILATRGLLSTKKLWINMGQAYLTEELQDVEP